MRRYLNYIATVVVYFCCSWKRHLSGHGRRPKPKISLPANTVDSPSSSKITVNMDELFTKASLSNKFK